MSEANNDNDHKIGSAVSGRALSPKKLRSGKVLLSIQTRPAGGEESAFNMTELTSAICDTTSNGVSTVVDGSNENIKPFAVKMGVNSNYQSAVDSKTSDMIWQGRQTYTKATVTWTKKPTTLTAPSTRPLRPGIPSMISLERHESDSSILSDLIPVVMDYTPRNNSRRNPRNNTITDIHGRPLFSPIVGTGSNNNRPRGGTGSPLEGLAASEPWPLNMSRCVPLEGTAILGNDGFALGGAVKDGGKGIPLEGNSPTRPPCQIKDESEQSFVSIPSYTLPAVIPHGSELYYYHKRECQLRSKLNHRPAPKGKKSLEKSHLKVKQRIAELLSATEGYGQA